MKKILLVLSALFITASAFAQSPNFFNQYYSGSPSWQSTYAGTTGTLWQNTFLNLWQVYNSGTATWQPINAFAVGKKYNGVIGSATLTVSQTGIVVDSVTAKDTLTLPSVGQFPVGTEIMIYDGTGNGTDSIYVTGGKTGGKQDSINASVTVLGINTAWGSVSFIAVPGNTNGIAAGVKSNGWIKK